MEGGSLEQKQINGQQYALIFRRRVDPDFYCLMGRFFGSRLIAKELGMPIYDDEHRLWFIVLNAEQFPIACTSAELKSGSQVVALKSAWVEPNERRKGLYDWMFATRLQYIEGMSITKITSITTEKSKHTHERYGFRHVGMRGKYYIYWKEVMK